MSRSPRVTIHRPGPVTMALGDLPIGQLFRFPSVRDAVYVRLPDEFTYKHAPRAVYQCLGAIGAVQATRDETLHRQAVPVRLDAIEVTEIDAKEVLQ